MEKILQKKFVKTAMIAISLLLLFLLGTINVANIVIEGKTVDRTLNMLCEKGNQYQEPKEKIDIPDEKKIDVDIAPPDISFRMPKNDYDTIISSNFFSVEYDFEGNIAKTDISRTSSLTEAQAEAMANEVKNEISGKYGKYKFLVKNNASNNKIVVFLDTSNEIVSYLRILLLSVVVGIVFWMLMLLLVIALSKKAIKPIAENIEKQKQFITNAGHEIKTPLAIIQSNTEAMELFNGENKYSKNIKRQTERLSNLMKNLLMLSKMDEAALEIKKEQFDFSILTEEMVDAFSPLLEEKKISFSKEIGGNIFINADKDHIEQLVSILLDNAIKYSNENGNIFVKLKKKDKNIFLTIGNTCDELPNVSAEKLFDRFYRGDSARTQKSGGYGIGLSMAQSIVSANKGKISAKYLSDNIIEFTAKF